MNEIRIVGGGLAGSILAMIAHENGHSISWWQSGSPTSSLVASGIYNPVVLKRLKLIWKAKEFADSANHFYSRMNDLLPRHSASQTPIWHRIYESGYQNDWNAAASLETHAPFLGPIYKGEQVYGELMNVGRLETPLWLELTSNFIEEHHRLSERTWSLEDHNSNVPTVLCTGWKSKEIPFGIPENAMAPVKGEVLTVRLPGYQLTDKIVHGGVFILPLKEESLKIGATYSWDSLDEVPTEKGRIWLLEQLSKLWDGPVEILKQEAAVRPAVKDRKPILGQIPGYNNLYVLNGLGSRGTLMAPLLSEWLLKNIFKGQKLPKEVSLERFY